MSRKLKKEYIGVQVDERKINYLRIAIHICLCLSEYRTNATNARQFDRGKKKNYP